VLADVINAEPDIVTAPAPVCCTAIPICALTEPLDTFIVPVDDKTIAVPAVVPSFWLLMRTLAPAPSIVITVIMLLLRIAVELLSLPVFCTVPAVIVKLPAAKPRSIADALVVVEAEVITAATLLIIMFDVPELRIALPKFAVIVPPVIVSVPELVSDSNNALDVAVTELLVIVAVELTIILSSTVIKPVATLPVIVPCKVNMPQDAPVLLNDMPVAPTFMLLKLIVAL
jgi:hypothetical protein